MSKNHISNEWRKSQGDRNAFKINTTQDDMECYHKTFFYFKKFKFFKTKFGMCYAFLIPVTPEILDL